MSTVSASDLRVTIASDTGTPDRRHSRRLHPHALGTGHGRRGTERGKTRARPRGGSFRQHSLRGGRGLATARAGLLAWVETEAQIGRNRREWRRANRPRARGSAHRGSGRAGRSRGCFATRVTAPCAGTTTSRSPATGRARRRQRSRRRRARSRRSCSAPTRTSIRARAALMDLAIPGQSVGLGAEAVRVLGREVARRRAREPPACRARDRPAHRRAQRAREAAAASGRARARASSRPSSRAASARSRGCSGRAESELPRMRGALRPGERARRASCRSPRRASGSPPCAATSATAPRPTSSAIAARPRSRCSSSRSAARASSRCRSSRPAPSASTGARASPRADSALVVGIGNGWLRYLPHASDLAHPLAHQHYEVLQSLFAPGACEALLGAGHALARELD